MNGLRLSIQLATLSEYDANGFLGLSFSLFGPNAGMPTPEAHHPFGHDGRPRDPTLDASGQPSIGPSVLRMSEGNVEYSLALGDPRATPKLPPLAKGGARLYADTGRAALPRLELDGDSGSATLTIPYADGAGAATVVADATAKTIRLALASGVAVELDTAAGSATVRNADGSAKVVVNAAGVATVGPTALGALSTDPGLLPVALEPALMAWITTVLIPALAASPGGPITVAPPSSFAATLARAK